ncbi:MAG: pyridoxal phosphate-dependent aminotransferase [Chloroflexota bacterium]
MTSPLRPGRTAVTQLETSLIRKLANQAATVEDIIPLWYGEPDQPTPKIIRDAAIASLEAGSTFYQPNLGLMALRQALADYTNSLYNTHFGPENMVVAGSGLMALAVASQCVVDQGSTIVTHAPTWPNLPAIQQLLGANIIRVPLRLNQQRWQLDLEQLFDACTPDTKMLLINSPSNPTGWMLTDEEQQAILDFCRERGLWLLADEVYSRIVYGRTAAPSFLDKISEDDQVLVINSFSKSWAMTGWRLGWITIPKVLEPTFEMLVEYNFSCVLEPTQQAGIVALQQGEPLIAADVARYQRARDHLLARLAEFPRITCPQPQATFYAWLAVEGLQDSFAFAEQAMHENRVGLAPGVAFGPEGEGHLRICFAAETDLIDEAISRLAPMLG